MSPSLDSNSARICDTTKEQLSLTLYLDFSAIFNFFLDIRSPVDQVQS